MAREQRVRAFLFYLSVATFFVGLPFILSFALGYKFDTKTFKFTKSGFLDLKTQPPGASIYLDGRLLNDKTPASINELLPGRYSLRLELDEHYPWLGEVNVEAGKVARLDKVILFPLRPRIEQLNKDRVSSFWMDREEGHIYYIDDENNAVYSSNLEGQEFRQEGFLPEEFTAPEALKISQDRKKLLCYNAHQIAVTFLNFGNGASLDLPFILDFPNRRITDVFWHSDSFHIILVSNKNIEVLEAKERPVIVNLVNLNKKSTVAFYDQDKDTLYFIDSTKAPDSKFYDNVYKLELNTKAFPLRELMRRNTDEE